MKISYGKKFDFRLTKTKTMHKVHPTSINPEKTQIIWYRRNGEPGKLEEAFKITGAHHSTDKQDGGKVFEQ